MKFRGQSLFTVFFMMLSLFAALVALTWDFKTALVPVFFGGAVFILSSLQLVKELRGSKTESTQIMDAGFRKGMTTRELVLGSVQYFGWLIGVYLGILVVGMYLSILFFIFLYLQTSHKVSVPKSLLLAVVTVAVVYVLINQIAQIVLPEPYLYRLLF